MPLQTKQLEASPVQRCGPTSLPPSLPLFTSQSLSHSLISPLGRMEGGVKWGSLTPRHTQSLTPPQLVRSTTPCLLVQTPVCVCVCVYVCVCVFTCVFMFVCFIKRQRSLSTSMYLCIRSLRSVFARSSGCCSPSVSFRRNKTDCCSLALD